MLKLSLYNRYICIDEKHYIYNLVSKAIVALESVDTLQLLKNARFNEIDPPLIQALQDANILCDDSIDEYLQILRLHRIIKYGNRNARLTLLPTLNCNFRCWYCYEHHYPSKMTEREINAVEIFARKLLSSNRLNSMTLDWFGGEPMLHFKSVIVPLSIRIRDLCKAHQVPFNNMITTNGSLFKSEQIPLLKDIELKQYQITLDGDREIHNKTRYSAAFPDSFKTIIGNILLLVDAIPQIDMTVRINCTKENIDSIANIIKYFPMECRNKICISMQIVWQQIDDYKTFSKGLNIATDQFVQAGFFVPSHCVLPPCPNLCYVDNMLHYTIAPDLQVYKCTARDFTPNSVNHIGSLTENGEFQSNKNILLYYQNAAFENEKCRACEFLPVCRVNCIQKHIEKEKIHCNKDELCTNVDNIIKQTIITRLKKHNS